MSYSQIPWLAICGGLTGVGLVLSWLAWRRRGAAAGLRGTAWSLLPLAAYLTGAVGMLWRIGTAITGFAASFVFSPLAWSGVAVTGLAAILFVVSGMLRSRRRRKPPAAAQSQPPGREVAQGKQPPGKSAGKTGPADEDFGDIADILRRHGIK